MKVSSLFVFFRLNFVFVVFFSSWIFEFFILWYITRLYSMLKLLNLKMVNIFAKLTKKCLNLCKTAFLILIFKLFLNFSSLENKVMQPSSEAISKFHHDLKKWQEVYVTLTFLLFQNQAHIFVSAPPTR